MKPSFSSLRTVLFLLASVVALSLTAQVTVSGTLTDQETSEPLIGASILAVGTSTGTVTDFDGTYSLAVPEGVTQLQFSYTGYPTLTQDIDGRTVIDLALAPGQLLDEVVVVGYGAVKKEDLTGSVATIDDETFNRGAIVSPTNLIAGKVAGVNISSGSGSNPGEGPTVRIRGGTSINASNNPLYVIDGVPISNNAVSGSRSALNFLNPDDIANMTVLKDASAAAIYGSRGANGVILITTKKGQSGAPRISYRGEGTVSSVINRQQNLDAAAFRDVVTFAAPDRLGNLGNASTNWFDELTRTAYGTQHNLSVSGGGETNTYRLSAGYQKLEGVIRGAETERISLNLNFSQRIFDDKLTVAASIKGANENNSYDPGAIGAALAFDPTQAVRDPANTTYAGYNEYGLSLAPRNPVSSTEQITNGGQAYRGIGNLDLEYNFDDLLPGLTYKAIVGFDVNTGRTDRFVPTTYATIAANGYSGEFEVANQTRTSKLFDTYFTYARDFGNQNASLQVGYSYQDFNNENPRLLGRDLESDAFGTANPGVAEDLRGFNAVVENRLISFFGRLNYNINEKYLLTASLRRDGSSRFGPDTRWGMFPSAALAWRILQEDFAAGLGNTFSDLKLRIGYGVTGNQDFGDYLYLPVYQFSDQRTQYQFGDRFVSTVRPNAYDADLKWEETTSLNVGLDFGFFNNRLSGILEVYQKTTNDLLFTVNVPAGTNLSDRVTTNIGSLENRGVELTLSGVAYDRDDFGLDITGNISYNNSEITKLDGSGSADIQVGGIEGAVGNNVQILRVGQAPFSFYLYEQKYGEDGRPLRDGVDYNDDGEVNNLDMYVDINGDGLLNDQDRRIIEKRAPDVLVGLTANARYRQLTLGFTLRGTIGNYVYNNASSNGGYLGRIDLNNGYVSNIHPSAVYTRFDRPQYFSDYYLENGSFLRLDNVSLGYDFGALSGGDLNLSLYATGQNLFLLTNYSGNDPEGESGIDNAPFPRARIFTVGARIGL